MSEEVDYDLTVIGALAPVCQVRSAWRRPADKSSSPKPKSVSAALSHCGFYPADTSIHREFDFTEYIDDYHYDFMTFNAPR